MNAVIFICYNKTREQLELSKRALDSILAQDIPVHVFITDNGSNEETWDWLYSLALPNVTIERRMENESPVKVSNEWMAEIFGTHGAKYVLGVANDVRLPPNAYSQMLRWPRGFVSASDIGHEEPTVYEAIAVNENTPMAVMLTRSWAYQAIVDAFGFFFDERYEFYASDCDLALRMCACGIRGVQLNVPFWHYGSASWRLSTPEAGSRITQMADVDRATFVKKWGFGVSDPRYSASASDINFRGESNV